MRNVLGNILTLTLFGESHQEQIGATIDGLPSGIPVDIEFIKECLRKRRPNNNNETTRIEDDTFKIISGVFNNFTTGSPLTIVIDNKNIHSNDYEINNNKARPSHADYVAFEKYHGFADYRGGGHFSGRLTTPIVACGAIVLKALEKLNIQIGTHILQCGDIKDVNFNNVDKEILMVNELDFPVISDVRSKMEDAINQAKLHNDSIGGIIQVAINNVPVGLGEPVFSSLEGELSKALFAIGGIKGIEFGLGFNFANKKASEVHDEFYIKNHKVMTKTNNNGGINGGISNGMPIIFNLAVKPTPSIYKKQKTIDMQKKINDEIIIVGRHDPAIIRRMNIVVRAMCAFVIADMLLIDKGYDIFK